MPDMKTALTNAVKDWALDDEGPGGPKPAVKPPAPQGEPMYHSQAQQIFVYVKGNNGALKRPDVQRAMVLHGMSSASASSVLAQLVKTGMLSQHPTTDKLAVAMHVWDDERWRKACREKYGAKRAAKRKADKPVKAAKAGAPVPAVPVAPQPVAGNTLLTADYVAANISFGEAAKLFRKLKEMLS